MKVFDSFFLAVGVVIAAEAAAAAAAANTVTISTEIVDITTSNPVIVDLSKDFEISNSFNDSPGMDMVNELAASWPNTRVVTVIQHGKIVGEYVRDDDVDPNQLHRVWSASKSVSGMLFGILVDQYGTSINTTLGEFFPNEIDWNLVDNESTVDYMKSLSAYEILTLTTGLGPNPCLSNLSCTSTMGGGDLQSTLAWPIINKEGERGAWEYMPIWNILSYITKEVTDLTPRELLAVKILPAIGILDTDIEWPLEFLGESLDVQQGAGGLELTTKQMAKIGQLIIQKGLAAPEGTQILSYEWIKTSLFPKTPVPATSSVGRETMYGYQWYSEKSEEFGDSYTAIGANGQFIVVHPQSGIVLAIQSDDPFDSTYDLEFDCSSCDWFFPLLNKGPDFFISSSTSLDMEDTAASSGDCASITDTVCAMEGVTVFCELLQNPKRRNLGLMDTNSTSTDEDTDAVAMSSPTGTSASGSNDGADGMEDFAAAFGFEDESEEFTLFVPTDAAFAEISDAFETLSDAEAGRVIMFHMYSGMLLTSDKLACSETITSMNEMSDASRTKCKNDGKKYQNGNGNTKTGSMPEIDTADHMACNGVIHTLDHVMFPVSLAQLHTDDAE